MTTSIKSGTQGFDAPGGGSRGKDDGLGLLHGRSDGKGLGGQFGKQGRQGQLSRENELELEKLQLAWKGERNPTQSAGRSLQEGFPWRKREDEHGAPTAGWVQQIDEYPLVAQYTAASALTSLFEPAAAVAGPRHPIAENVEELVRSLVNRMDLNPLEKQQAPRTNFELVLDRSVFGISGINLSMTPGSLSVLLVGVADPVNPQLMAAGQQLVRGLQKCTGVRSVRLHATTEESRPSSDEDGVPTPMSLARRNELH